MPNAPRFLLAAILAAGCSGGGDADQQEPDAAPPPMPDAAEPPPMQVGAPRGPSVGFDTLALTGANPTFMSLGNLGLNAQLKAAIESGMLNFVLEMKGLDDPTGQNDSAITLELHQGLDVDATPTNNYNVTNPNKFISASPTMPIATLMGSITNGTLQSSFNGSITIAGLTVANAQLTGTFVASGTAVGTLNTGKVRGPTTGKSLGGTPVMGLPCPGTTLLDVLVRGCVVVAGVQPDADLDGDGLERFADTNADGRIDRCTDGNGTITNGVDCWNTAAFADGYNVELTVHGTRVLFFDPPPP